MPQQKFKSKIYPLTSSDAVIWEGEDLPCINLCTGDTVSDVVYKLALQINAMKIAYNLKELDLKTVFKACIACSEPVKTLQNVLTLIINKIASIDDIIAGLNGNSGTTDEKILTLASCFLPRTNADGDPITKLPHSDYTRVIASTVCTVMNQVDGLSVRVEILEEDFALLSSAINSLGGIPKVSPTCVAPTNTPIEITTGFSLLEKQFCELRKVTGLPSDLAQGVSKQPTVLADADQLGNNGVMGSLTGWKSPVSTVADSLANLWLTITDMRGSLKAIQDNCCKVNCDSIKVDFDIKLDDSRTTATLFFAAKSKIPVGFKDCDSYGNILHIVDSNGAMYEARIKIADVAKYTSVDNVMTDSGVVIDLTGTPVDPNLDYTFNMDACMTNGDLTCQKCITKTATYKNTCSYCEITVSAGSDITGELIVVIEETSSDSKVSST